MTCWSEYQGITHGMDDEFLDDPRFVEAWKRERCSKGIHLLDEVWSVERHYLHCDVCGLEVHIKGFVKEENKRP